MGQTSTTNLQLFQLAAFSSPGSEWEVNNAVSPRLFGSGQFLQFLNSGTFTFVVPSGVTSIRIRVVGGGGGGTQHPSQGGGGGGGGGYAHGVFTVTPGTSYTVTVGAGGNWSTGNAQAGGTSSFGALISGLNWFCV